MIDRSAAVTSMQSLFSGLESRMLRQRMLPYPNEGTLYDFDPNRVSRRSLRRGDLSPGGSGPFLRRESVGLLHKPMMGLAAVKICVVLEFGYGANRFDTNNLNDAVRWSLAPMRPDVFFFIGFAGVREYPDLGHSDELVRALSGGVNWRAALVEYVNPGWAVTAPKDGMISELLFDNLFDPESPDAKEKRVDAALASSAELREPGGFLLLDDLAERLGVHKGIVTYRARSYAERTAGIEVKEVGGNLIIQRDRFESVRA